MRYFFIGLLLLAGCSQAQRIMHYLKRTLVLIFILGQLMCYGQSELKTKIIGKWEGAKKETIKGRKTLNNGQPMKEISIYEFERNGQVIQHLLAPNYRVPYSIKGDELTIGTFQYVIEKLTDKELVLLDIKDGNRSDPLAFRRYFKKVRSTGKSR